MGKHADVLRLSKQVTTPSETKPRDKDWDVVAREETKLVQRLFLLPGQHAPRVVVFAGVEHENGCSTICARAAEALSAHVSGSVCLVDADLRSPVVHQRFGVENLRGLTETVLQSGPIRNFAQRYLGSNLWLLTGGFHVVEPRLLLTSDGLRSRIVELRSEFNHVLIDVAPINDYSDAVQLGQLTDGVVLVVEANVTRRQAIQKAKETLEAANVRLLGAVLNKRTFPIPERLYRRV